MSIFLYRKTGVSTSHRCECGFTHEHQIYERISVTDTGKTYTHNNGYEKSTQSIFQDAAGNEYYKCVTVDYYSNVFFTRRDDDGNVQFWTPHIPTKSVEIVKKD